MTGILKEHSGRVPKGVVLEALDWKHQSAVADGQSLRKESGEIVPNQLDHEALRKRIHSLLEAIANPDDDEVAVKPKN